jgi:hypothetical protein
MRTTMHRLTRITVGLALAATLIGACQAARATTTLTLTEESGSGVTGSVTLTDAGRGRTQVLVKVDHNGLRDMPAHIHSGTCGALVPQPKFPLANVRDGTSMTIVPATLTELRAGGLAVNLHKSVDELKVSTACANLH